MKNVFSAIAAGIKKIRARAVLAGAAAALGAFVVFMTVWLLIPIEEVPPSRLVPSGAFGFFSLSLDRENPGIAEAFSLAEERFSGPDTGTAKRIAAKTVLSSGVPKNLVVMLGIDGESEKPEILVTVDGGRLLRTVRLLPRPVGRIVFRGQRSRSEWMMGHRFSTVRGEPKKRGMRAFTVAGDTMILGSSLSVVEGSYARYRGVENFGRQRVVSGLLHQASMRRDIALYADNGGGGMTAFVKAFEESLSFAAFPSIDAVSTIRGNVRILSDELRGSAVFQCRGSEGIDGVRSDVKFLYGAMRRVLRARDLDMRGDILVEGNTVRFDFEVPGFTRSLFTAEQPEQGDRE